MTKCKIWKGALHTNGYGKLTRFGKTLLAHRYVWEREFGKIPEGMQVCHTCDVKACVNPRHLFLGTQSDNMKDCVAKGRHRFVLPPKAFATFEAARSLNSMLKETWRGT